MKSSQLSINSTKAQNISFDTPQIIHFIPDFGQSLYQVIDNLPIITTNLETIIVKQGRSKIGQDNINNDSYHNEVKNLINAKYNVTSLLPKIIHTGKYVIVDHSAAIKSLKLSLNKLSPSILFQSLIKYLKQDIVYNKRISQNIKQNILFDISSGEMLKLVDSLMGYQPDMFEAIFKNLVSDYVLCTTNIGDKKEIELIAINHKDNIILLKQNLLSVKKTEEKKIELNISHDSEAKDKLGNDIAKNAITKDINEVINSKKLVTVLKKYNFKDPAIINNIKLGLERYLLANHHTLVKDSDLNNVVLKSIKFSIDGSDELSDEEKDNPNVLKVRLIEYNSYSRKIIYPKVNQNIVCQPGDIISFNEITGPVRHKIEFSDNLDFVMNKLVKSLENISEYPTRIINTEKEFIDDNRNRVVKYTYTLQHDTIGDKQPYPISFNLPALVNDKYFKLNGNEYVMISQQYLRPLTKDKPLEARFLTHFSMIRIAIQNMKFGVSQIQEVLDYCRLKYSSYIKHIELEGKHIKSVEFKSGYIFSPDDNKCYEDKTQYLDFDNGVFYLYDKEKKTKVKFIGKYKNEFLYEQIKKVLSKINPKDRISEVTKKIPFIRTYIGSKKIPLIILFAQKYGLLNALTNLGIHYEIGNISKTEHPGITIQLKNDNRLFIFTNNTRQELLANGLIYNYLDKFFLNVDKTQLNDKEIINNLMMYKYGNSVIKKLDSLYKTMIDPTTKELLEFENHPTEVIDILKGPLLNKLLNDKVDHSADLNNLRVRQSEVMTNILYSQLMMSVNAFKEQANINPNIAKIKIDPEYVILNLQGKHIHSKNNSSGSLLEFISPFSPVQEMVVSSKVSKSGPGGIPSARALRKQQRMIHSSYIGNIGLNSFSESAPGETNYHTLGASISNNFGLYGMKDKAGNLDNYNFDYLSIDEALVPFVSQMNADRLVLARTHNPQKIPLSVGYAEPAIVQTGAEYIVAQCASSKFIWNAKEDGEVIEYHPNEYTILRYTDTGKEEIINTLPRFSTTKRGSVLVNNIQSLKKGDKFIKGQMVTFSPYFNGETAIYGINCNLAIINYMGYSYEDAYVITENLQKRLVADTTEKIQVIVPPNTKVLKMANVGDVVKNGESLIEFQYLSSLDEYLNTFELDDSDEPSDDDDSLFVSQKDVIKRLSAGGEIVDIKIRANNIKNADPVLIGFYTQKTRQIKNIQKNLARYAVHQKDKLIDNLDETQLRIGNHKLKRNVYEGVLLEFYVRQPKEIQIGDKLANRFGAKGVIAPHIIPFEKIPHGEYSGDIDVFLAPAGVLGRKNSSILKEIYLGKIIKFLPSKIKGLKPQSAKKLIFDVYNVLDHTKGQKILKSIKTQINHLTDEEFELKLNNNTLIFNFIIPPFVAMPFESLKEAGKILNIPLDEKVYIPELKQWTKIPVPVGPQYFSRLEQTADDYSSVRSTGGYVSSTGQPTKGKSKNGGQTIGFLDIQAMIAGNNINILKEMYGPRSDYKRAKTIMLSKLMSEGTFDLDVSNVEKGKTQELFKTLMNGMCLDIT